MHIGPIFVPTVNYAVAQESAANFASTQASTAANRDHLTVQGQRRTHKNVNYVDLHTCYLFGSAARHVIRGRSLLLNDVCGEKRIEPRPEDGSRSIRDMISLWSAAQGGQANGLFLVCRFQLPLQANRLR